MAECRFLTPIPPMGAMRTAPGRNRWGRPRATPQPADTGTEETLGERPIPKPEEIPCAALERG